jgi:hypothetical protein
VLKSTWFYFAPSYWCRAIGHGMTKCLTAWKETNETKRMDQSQAKDWPFRFTPVFLLLLTGGKGRLSAFDTAHYCQSEPCLDVRKAEDLCTGTLKQSPVGSVFTPIYHIFTCFWVLQSHLNPKSHFENHSDGQNYPRNTFCQRAVSHLELSAQIKAKNCGEFTYPYTVS